MVAELQSDLADPVDVRRVARFATNVNSGLSRATRALEAGIAPWEQHLNGLSLALGRVSAGALLAGYVGQLNNAPSGAAPDLSAISAARMRLSERERRFAETLAHVDTRGWAANLRSAEALANAAQREAAEVGLPSVSAERSDPSIEVAAADLMRACVRAQVLAWRMQDIGAAGAATAWATMARRTAASLPFESADSARPVTIADLVDGAVAVGAWVVTVGRVKRKPVSTRAGTRLLLEDSEGKSVAVNVKHLDLGASGTCSGVALSTTGILAGSAGAFCLVPEASVPEAGGYLSFQDWATDDVRGAYMGTPSGLTVRAGWARGQQGVGAVLLHGYWFS